MGMNYRFLDWQNGIILSGFSAEQMCVAIKALHGTYTSSWAIMNENERICTADFIQKPCGFWKFYPLPLPAKAF